MYPARYPVQKLRASFALFRAQPLPILVIGGALVVALASVCCAFGAIAAPWFGCELFATQLEAGTGRRPPRTRAWLGAGLFLLGAVVLVSSAAWLATLGLGPDMPVFEASPRETAEDVRTVALSVSGALLALVFIVPFLYAPMILVDRGGSIGGAALESARFVAESPARHLALSIGSHVVQASPLVISASVTALFAGRAEVPWAVLAATPLLAITIPLGQGMIVAAWIERRDRLVDPDRTRPEGRPGRALSVALTTVLLAPIVSLGLVIVSLARPSEPRIGHAPEGEQVIEAEIEPGSAHSFTVPTTALAITVARGWFGVEASDGGGAGRLPRPDGAELRHLRVVRVRDAYAVEAQGGASSYVTWVSRAGVRLDDDLRARVADRLGLTALAALALALLITPLAVARVLVQLAEVRRRAAEGEGSLALRQSAARMGAVVVVALLPVSTTALVIALRALLG